MIRTGLVCAILGSVLLGLYTAHVVSLIGIIMIGLGIAPVYPGLVHETPKRFGTDKSAKVMSLQMVGSYVGASIVPPLIGLVAGGVGMAAFAAIIPVLLACLLVNTEVSNRLAQYKR